MDNTKFVALVRHEALQFSAENTDAILRVSNGSGDIIGTIRLVEDAMLAGALLGLQEARRLAVGVSNGLD